MSSGVPSRPTGMPAIILQDIGGDLGHHVGITIAGSDRVDRDLLARPLQRQRPAKAENTGFGGGVIGLPSWPFSPLTELILTIRPNSRARMPSMTWRHILNIEPRLVLMTCHH